MPWGYVAAGIAGSDVVSKLTGGSGSGLADITGSKTLGKVGDIYALGYGLGDIAGAWGSGAGAAGGASAAPAAAGATDAGSLAAGAGGTSSGMTLATDLGGGGTMGGAGTDVLGGASAVPAAPAGAALASTPQTSTVPASTGTPSALTKYGPLAMYGVGQVGQNIQGKKLADAMKNVGAPQRAQGQQLLSQYQSGQINPADQYAIDQWKSGALAQSRQYFAQAGLSDSQQAKDAENQINAQAVSMKQNALNTVLQQGLSILNVTDQYQQQAIMQEMGMSQQAIQNATNFFNTYGQWLRNTPSMTGATGQPATPATTPSTPAPTA